jgi:ElaB/YqjD/DUF883 family membrane-anchored ribosome-binding protein
MMSKNLEVCQKELDEINQAFQPPKGLADYKKNREGIYKKYSVKDEKDYEKIPEETKKSLDAEIKKLEDDHKALFDEIEALEKEKTEFLKEEIEVKLYKLQMDLMPNISQENKYSSWDIWAMLLKYVIIEPND